MLAGLLFRPVPIVSGPWVLEFSRYPPRSPGSGSYVVKGPLALRTIAPTSKGVLTMAKQLACDLSHERVVPAAIRLEIKSTRASRPGHPMIRVTAVCATHARELRRLGLQLVGP